MKKRTSRPHISPVKDDDDDNDERIETKDHHIKPPKKIIKKIPRPCLRPVAKNLDKKEPIKSKVKILDSPVENKTKSIDSVPINFIFNDDGKNKKKYNSFKLFVNTNMEIKELEAKIANIFNIKRKLNIQYKENDTKFTIDANMNISDIIDEMVQHNKEGSTNVLYIDFSSQDDDDRTLISTINIENYKIIKKIGSGSYSTVYKVQNLKTKKFYAAKVIKNTDAFNDDQILEKREIQILKEINHKRIIKLIGLSLTDFNGNDNVTLIMEYIKNQTLSYWLENLRDKNLKTLSQTEFQIILIDIAWAMMYLHENNIMHRDLKPDNILIDKNNRIVITDFGLSKIYEKGSEQTIGRATPIYQAPETIDNDNYELNVDVYSFAIILYEIVTGLPAYEKKYYTMSIVRFLLKIKNGLRPSLEVPMKESFKELLKECWNADPKKRPTFDVICQKLAFDQNYYLEGADADIVLSYANKIIKKKE